VPVDAPAHETTLVWEVSSARLASSEIERIAQMLLHEVPTKTACHLGKRVTETDIPGIPATIALHGLMKALARQIRWLLPQSYLLLKIKRVTGTLSGYL
jgi:hypothetical protein